MDIQQPEIVADAFRTHGYVHLRRFFAKGDLEVLTKVADELIDAEEVAGKWMKYFELSRADEGIQLLNRVESFLDYWPTFASVMRGKRIDTLLRTLFNGDYFLFKEKLNFKLIGGGGYSPHQDGAAWKTLLRESITLAIPVDPADEGNGTLMVDGDFRWGRNLQSHTGGKLALADKIRWAPMSMLPGDVVAFSSYLAHMSHANCGSRNRRTYFVTFNHADDGDQREAYFRYKRSAFPPRIERPDDAAYDGWRGRLSRKLI